VEDSDRMIPVRLDQVSGLLDLKKSGGPDLRIPFRVSDSI
jgi:hypothetical protein